MPSGVASHFLQVLETDGRGARNRVVAGALLCVGLAALAWFLFPWQGLVVHALAVVVGALAGAFLARARVRRYEASIRGTWTQWMRFAVAAESVPEIHRKVRGRSGRNLPYVYAAVLFVVWGLEVGLLVLRFLEDAPEALAAPVIALNGVLAGGLLAHFIGMGAWYRRFRASVGEMVDAGEIGMWGVM